MSCFLLDRGRRPTGFENDSFIATVLVFRVSDEKQCNRRQFLPPSPHWQSLEVATFLPTRAAVGPTVAVPVGRPVVIVTVGTTIVDMVGASFLLDRWRDVMVDVVGTLTLPGMPHILWNIMCKKVKNGHFQLPLLFGWGGHSLKLVVGGGVRSEINKQT